MKPWRRRAQRRRLKGLDGRRRDTFFIDGVTPRSLSDVRAEWLAYAAAAKSVVYFVDGEQVGSLSDVRTALEDGKTHAVYLVAGEQRPELLTGPFGREFPNATEDES